MPAPTTVDEFLQLVRKSGLVDEKRLDAYLQTRPESGPFPTAPGPLAEFLVRDGILTRFQADQLLEGKWRRYQIGKYKVLERIGSGGMGSVYLCEHLLMRRRVAVKVLPVSKSEDTSAQERFYREARAVAALDHPNIVRAYDTDQDGNLHFLVMEYVDGANLQEIIKRSGPLDILRAVHYTAAAALALQHAHEVAGIVHRDIKPGNILVDRNGVVKVLDMGLARFFHDEEDLLTQKYDENVLGTADYLAPEQALDSHSVDIRADIYSLGATLYFCLTGKAPFSEGTIAQKLIWHQTRQPKPIRALRPEVPEALAAILEKMMAKDPSQRYQTPIEVAEALAPWTRTPIPPPPETEMPRLSPAAMGVVPGELGSGTVSTTPSSGPSSRARKVWQVPASPAPRPAGSPPPPRGRSGGGPESAPPQASATVVPSPAAAEEHISWEALAAETKDALVQTDTDRHQTHRRRPASAARLSPPGLLDRLRQVPPLWLVAGGVLVVLVCVVGLWAALGRREPAKPPPATPVVPRPQTLKVRRGGQERDNTYGTLRDALARAKKQDRITILEEVIEEQIQLVNARLAQDVTIESGLEGKPVRWIVPTQLREGEPLLKINGIEGLRLRGINLDGLGRVKDLVTIAGVCPGLTLEDVELRGFTGRGISLVNCEGRADKPVHFSRLRIIRGHARETGLFFDALPNVRDGVNQHIMVMECRVEGGGEAGKVLMTSEEVIRDVQFVWSPKPEKVKPPPEKPKPAKGAAKPPTKKKS